MAEGELIANDPSEALVAVAGPTVSVILDAVGWVEGTLTTIVRLTRRALGDREVEIIVATGNGVETTALEEECLHAGVRHAPFEAEHHHAAAMNNAAAAASGEYLVLLEEDFVLAERSIQSALEHLAATGSDIAVLECRDGVLPIGRTIHDLEEVSDRRYFESVPRTASNRGTSSA